MIGRQSEGRRVAILSARPKVDFGEVWSILASLREGAAKGMITSFIIRYLGWQAAIRVVWPRQRLSAHWVAPCKMRPLAFLDPSAFHRTEPHLR